MSSQPRDSSPGRDLDLHGHEMDSSTPSEGSGDKLIMDDNNVEPLQEDSKSAEQKTLNGRNTKESIRQFFALRKSGIEYETTVVFNDISVEGIGTGTLPAPTILSAMKSAFGVLNPLQHRLTERSSRPILRAFSGTIDPGEMLLVIGKPGSGCTTFLKTLSYMWEEYKEVQGGLTLNGHPIQELLSKRPQDVIFCAESDDHFPTLTVAETLRFAVRARCRPDTSPKDIDMMVSQFARLVGLEHVIDTKVGDAYIRGVSGGERRRVSLAEALATCARLICFDNPTCGLDSSTALEFIKMMREWTDQSRCVTAMSVYQASDMVVAYFDKVLVINSGRQIFYGKLHEAKSYFEGLGFECLPTTTISDFLNSMSADPDVRRVQEGKQRQVPRTSEELETAFHASRFYKTLQESMSEVQKEITSKPRDLVNTPAYSLPVYRQTWYCASRQFRIIMRNRSLWAVEPLAIIVQSLALGTLFRDEKRATQSLFIFASSLFFTVLVPALQSMAEFRNGFEQRPLILKQKRYRICRPISYALGLVITDVVWKIASISYNIPLYFLTGFQRNTGNFFIWFLVIYIEHLALSMFFRSVAVFSPSIHRAILPVGIFFNMYVLYTGFYVPEPQMQVWLSWLRYLNPLYYAFESVMVNEFRDLSYHCSSSDIVPSGSAYTNIDNQVCAVVGSRPGELSISGMSYIKAPYGFERAHLWRNVGINAALFVFFALCSGIGMERLSTPAGKSATVFYKQSKLRLKTKSDIEGGYLGRGVAPEGTAPVNHNNQCAVQDRSHTFAWKNLCLDIKFKDGNRRLLDNLSGCVKSGQLKALMGVSGAGKTTLLNALAGRSSVGSLTGELALNGKLLPEFFRSRMGYVQQQDIHLPTQTVREALQMTARLRRKSTVSLEEKYTYVEKVIQWLGMENIADALIGIPGVEMASKPEILFLDEPTSGLDGQSAFSIIQLLRVLSDSGQAIVCTIHQPAAELIEMFDELCLLSRGGKLIYDGPLGVHCQQATQYFEKHSRKCGPGENPAEFFLDVIGAGTRNDIKKDWPNLWHHHKQNNHGEKLPEGDETKIQTRGQIAPSKQRQSLYAAPFHIQLWVVLQRTWLYYWREPDYIVSKIWLNVGNSLLNGLSYLQASNTQQGAYSRVFSAFMALIVGPPLGLQVQPRFVTLREIFLLQEIFLHRERESLTYNWLTFVLSAFIVELPFTFITSLVYWLLWYFPVGYFGSASRAGYSFLMYELFGVFETSLAQLCASIMPNIEAAFAANRFFFMFYNTLAGTMSPKSVTSSGWRWYYTVSPLYYYNEGVVTDILHDLPIRCQQSEMSTFYPPNGTSCGQYAADSLQTATGYLMNPESLSDCQYCKYRDGQSYYHQYGFDFANRYSDIGIFIGFIALNFTMVIVMTYLLKIRR
ncbi:ATP-binding cassette transporter, putative [Talaromyces stipitatus ATCC 10500]|uniref:ATP-binding cassette transporter, putative n=1 Tax=Talaromyces stipitatus (strain ATCC 10500 / CBS 375.48 / QM 6759 / NRRL 1006) TaxID=441959 RepID=B8MC26_TALSN|nr:ATP-binding cassette transporter, putative [Talaromyces stipitatus ATCC 10500]EED18472.1 ATP-binding cassette transporter, putative [Talaromyces stipitatus ATCC 10500]